VAAEVADPAAEAAVLVEEVVDLAEEVEAADRVVAEEGKGFRNLETRN
jgi:hypothetical protein